MKSKRPSGGTIGEFMRACKVFTGEVGDAKKNASHEHDGTLAQTRNGFRAEELRLISNNILARVDRVRA